MFLRSLDRPLTRSLFRLLDARRYDPLSLSDPLPSIRVGLIEWAKDCKIANLSPDKIRRTLQGAHEELIERGYLRAVDIDGKGSRQVITYHFQLHPGTGPVTTQISVDNEALRRMIDRRISKPVAVRLLTQFGEEHILRRLDRGAQILAGGFQPKSAPGFLVDVIKDVHGKYDDLSVLEAPEVLARRLAVQARVAQTVVLEEQKAQADFEGAMTTPEARAAAALPVLKLVLGSRLSQAEYALLQQRLLSPAVDAGTLSRDALAAKVGGSVDSYLQNLRKLLRSP